jgi:hypothetical protein
VTQKYIPKYFSQKTFDEFYTKMQHDDSCDYNPYDNLEYYNINEQTDEMSESEPAA